MQGVFQKWILWARIRLSPLRYLYFRIFRRSCRFVFRGKPYPYFYQRYQTTWRNERAVEIPIVWEIVQQFRGQSILEVGNVLSHYFPVSHDIVDKYEKADGVTNQDVVDFQPSQHYDLIVSISTLEHVGWDEEPRDPQKIITAIKHLQELLTPQGKMVVTMPVGHNPIIDELVTNGTFPLNKLYYLKRTSRNNEWVEVKLDGIRGIQYGTPFPAANGLVIGLYGKENF